MQTDHLILARRPDLIVINKKKENFSVPADHWIKLKESEKMDKLLDLAGELKKTIEYEGVSIKPIVIGSFATVTKGL